MTIAVVGSINMDLVVSTERLPSDPGPEAIDRQGADGEEAAIATELGMAGVIQWLELNGFIRASTVREPGDYAVRGGILDVYPAGSTSPNVNLREEEMSENFGTRVLVPIVTRAGRLARRVTPVDARERLDQKLMLAGSPAGWVIIDFPNSLVPSACSRSCIPNCRPRFRRCVRFLRASSASGRRRCRRSSSAPTAGCRWWWHRRTAAHR